MAVVIYKILNKVNGKCYIGQTNNFKLRISQHCSPTSECKAISAAIQKYGKESFVFEKMCIVDDHMANDTEELAIKSFNTLAPNGYNLVVTCEHNRLLSDETRARMSKAKLGHQVSVETRNKIAIGHRGRPASAETKAKMSAVRKGRPGFKHTEESRANISKAKKGTVSSPEVIAKRSIGLKAAWARRKATKLALEQSENVALQPLI